MIRCGILGMGKIGKLRAREIQRNSKSELIAVYDMDPEAPGEYKGFSCSSVEELLDQDLDAVFVCTFNHVNAPYSIQALKSGKHVFCEKPPARTSEEVRGVIEAEKNSGKVLKYGFNHRYHSSVMEAKKMVDNRLFGKLLWLRGVYGKAGGNLFAQNWRNRKEYSGGGILIDQGIHMLDLMMHFAGEFTEVRSLVQASYWDVEVEDNVFAIMSTQENVSGTIHSSATQWRHKFSLEMCFEEGYINLDGILSSTRSYGDETLVLARRQFEDSAFAFGKPREERIYFDTDDSWSLELDEFLEAIEGKKSVEFGKSDDALRVMRLIETIYEQSGFYSDK
jgi:predicted dehydrogenase